VFLGPQGVEISWSPSSEEDLAGYRVYRIAPPGEPPVKIGELSPSQTSFKDPAPKPGVINAYTLTAFDKAGNESAGSNPIQVRP
jgi:fibronectin type 3 domain-containing protein